jgi:two-component system sensor histidine kinase MtrB
MRNLLSNALDHCEGKEVVVTIVATESEVGIGVRDFGSGLDESALIRVFDRFWRADPARKRTSGGTGLGLAISLEDANLHSGWLQVAAKPNEGSTFRLTLPRYQGSVFSQSPLPLPPRKKQVKDES